MNVRKTTKTQLLHSAFPDAIKAFVEAGYIVQELSNDDKVYKNVYKRYKRATKYIFKVFAPDTSKERGYTNGGYIVYHKDGYINYHIEKEINGKLYKLNSIYCAKIARAENYEKAKLAQPYFFLTTDKVKP